MEIRLLFATKRLPPGGVWLMDTGRGPQKEIAKSPKLPKVTIENKKQLTANTKDTKDTTERWNGAKSKCSHNIRRL
jgi:hypothetical protein